MADRRVRLERHVADRGGAAAKLYGVCDGHETFFRNSKPKGIIFSKIIDKRDDFGFVTFDGTILGAPSYNVYTCLS